MSQGLNDIMSSTDELMDVDTSFLDAYRTSGHQGPKKAQEQTEKPQADEPDKDTRPGPTSDDPDREHGALQRSGSGGSTGTPPPAPAHGDQVSADPAFQEAVAEAHPLPQSEHDDLVPPVSLQHTDHQDAVQSAAVKGGTGAGDEGSHDALPQTGFRLSGVKSQPAIRALPETVVRMLREQLRSAAVRELGVSDLAAREFTERLSQASMVTAFLLAQLDLGLATDAATHRAAQLFRSRDPVLGTIVARMENLERRERERAESLNRLEGQLGQVTEVNAAIEQAVAYSIADRTSNFLRGSHNIHDAPITHKDALFVRDKVREATKKQSRLEQEREGRPIR